ncbi:hypothetical protein AU512_14940 [Lonsdalea iberica]|uniref:Uncharacterized protein n=1 Tax=Lonsdalea iberica TaxID=1082703 RepID=A0ABX3XCJ5_9GAMM|nr:hypothetical protein AU512_14940 [Lonsdalea iberica]
MIGAKAGLEINHNNMIINSFIFNYEKKTTKMTPNVKQGFHSLQKHLKNGIHFIWIYYHNILYIFSHYYMGKGYFWV